MEELLTSMTWHGIEGHDNVVEKLRRAVARNRLASSFLFCGPAGVGKRTFALRFAQALLCHGAAGGGPRSVQYLPELRDGPGRHASRYRSRRQTGGQGVSAGRNCSSANCSIAGARGSAIGSALKPFMGGRRIAIIDDADFFNARQGPTAC